MKEINCFLLWMETLDSGSDSCPGFVEDIPAFINSLPDYFLFFRGKMNDIPAFFAATGIILFTAFRALNK